MSAPKNSKEPRNSKTGEERDKRKQIKHKAQQAAIQMRMQSKSSGSYTGTAHDGGAPDQDADDL